MPIFSRRRLQAMLDEIAPLLDDEKGGDLLGRLNHRKDVEQVLPAEMELALLWALSGLGHLEVERHWPHGAHRPDAFTRSLVPGRECAIEIAAPNDNALSGEEAMDRIALQISNCASKATRGLGAYLYFTFREESGYEAGSYIRRRLAPVGLKLADAMKAEIADWVISGRSASQPLRLAGDGLDVAVRRETHKQIRFHNLHSTMPPEAYSLEKNPLYTLMDRKLDQLKATADGTCRMIFLADVGSTLLNRLGQSGEQDDTRRRFSGSEILAHFLRRHVGHLDAIVAFTPRKVRSAFLGGDPLEGKPRRWDVTYFGGPSLPQPPAALQQVAGRLPVPHYEGYQARSLFRQGALLPTSHGRYLAMIIESTMPDNFQVKFPARMLLDLLAGRMTEEQFRHRVDPDDKSGNLFKRWLDSGYTISGSEMAPRDIDEDDDHIVLHFSDDAAARPFRLNCAGSRANIDPLVS